jgi:hypothetical protein
MKATISAAIAALLLPLPAAAQWLSPAASQSYNSWQQTQQRLQMQQQEYRIQQLESQQRQQQGFYQTRYQCGSSFYQCR